LGGLKGRNHFEIMALNGRIIAIGFLKKCSAFGGRGPDLSDSLEQ
jgi:hypothetical protein